MDIGVSIIIVNYNTTRLTYECVESILSKTSVNFEVIVVDNDSADRSIDHIVRDIPQVNLIKQSTNLGFGKANNEGIKIARGKYVLLINSDTYLINDAIDIFYQFMESNPEIGCCGGDLFQADGSPQVSYGNFPSFGEAVSAVGFKIFYKRYFDEHLSSGVVNSDNRIRKVDYLCGADMFIRKSALDKVGLFDPRFFLYFEETEFSLRLHRAGFPSVIIPSAKIVHLEGGSQSESGLFNYKKIAIFSGSRTLFFQIRYGRFVAWVVKVIYSIQALFLAIFKRQAGYIKVAGIIFKS